MVTKTTENTGNGSPHTVCDSTQGTDMESNLDHSFSHFWSLQEDILSLALCLFSPHCSKHIQVWTDFLYATHLKNIATVYKAAILPRNIEIMAFIAIIIKCLKTIQTWLVFVVLFFLGDRFHSRPFLHVHIGTLTGTLKLSAEVKKKKKQAISFSCLSLFTGIYTPFKTF